MISSRQTRTLRRLHRTPELLFDEKMTSAKIASLLTSLNVNFTTGWAKNTKRAGPRREICV